MGSRRFSTILLATGITFGVLAGASNPRASSAPVAPATTSTTPPTNPAEFIDLFAAAYRNMDLDLYGALLAQRPRDGIEFRFVLFEPTTKGETEWGYDEEMRVHRRMFRPHVVLPGETPVPRTLWPQSIDVTLEPLTGWSERFDLYRSDQNPTGPLDRKRWRAMEALHATAVTWHTQGRGDLSIAGQARFVVVEDLVREPDAPHRFLLYDWEDLGPGNVAQAAR